MHTQILAGWDDGVCGWGDACYATLQCYDANGELYYVTFARDRLIVSSYSDDAILGKVETWADTVAGLA